MGDGQGGHFPPIGSYGFLSDCHTSALVSYDGSVEWLCLPRFDSPSVFAALLDRGAGHFRIWPKGVVVPISRRYEPGTLIIETTWVTDTGWVVVIDSLSIGEWAPEGGDSGRPQTGHESDSSLLRVAHCIDGEVELRLECLPRFDYGAEAPRWSGGELGIAVAEGDGRQLTRQHRFRAQRLRATWLTAPSTFARTSAAFCAIDWDPELGGPRSAPEALERLESTREFWREWLRHGDFPDHPWRIHLQRSALVLKGLTHAPTGAIVAAADHLAAGDAGRRAQLGLPLQLGPRLDLLALGDAHPRLRRGGPRLHGLPRRHPAQGPRAPDHVRGRTGART